ncbi:hypothetical protein M8C21_000146 [Ambrosia artemisiifolia]|uniref:Uncharacterized protein n=1 Tax=Ambrosia artemisiifolia TaxID=4212 RepID=A0AAD5GLM4_AMBAR|nr:hypothetical protein M8C21_000146 [Ambrosia artemisiifolia]
MSDGTGGGIGTSPNRPNLSRYDVLLAEEAAEKKAKGAKEKPLGSAIQAVVKGMLRIGAASIFTPIPDAGDIQDYYYEFATRAFLELQSEKTKGIAGTLQLKTTNASYVYLNPKAAETRMLEELYKSGVPCGTHSTILTEHNILLSHILQMSDRDIKGKYFTVNGIIQEIDAAKDWHYTGCPTCNQLVYPTANRWFCTRDGTHPTANNL